jgi:hypothetical protein
MKNGEDSLGKRHNTHSQWDTKLNQEVMEGGKMMILLSGGDVME